MLESHESSSWESAPGKKAGGREVRASAPAFRGQRIPQSPPGPTALPSGAPAGGGSGGRGRLGGRGQTELLKMAAAEANDLAHLPRKAGAAQGRRSSARATQRNHGETFSVRAGRRAQGLRRGPGLRARLSSPAGASARPRLAAPSGAPAGAISKSFPEVSGPPPAASRLRAVFPPPPAARRAPRPPSASLCGCGAPGSAGWSGARGGARLGAAGLVAVAKRPEP